VATFVAITVAPGTAPPPLSFTVPAIDPVSTCPYAGTFAIRIKTETNKKSLKINFM
jgi:hypothetical protein